MALHGQCRIRLYLCLIIPVLFSCKKEKKQNETVLESKKNMVVQAPIFNQDSAYYFIEKQVSFGPRVPNTAAHKKCGNFIIKTLEDNGWKTTIQEFTVTAFDGKKLNARNIIGTINPDAKKRILLTAHWDTRPFADQDSVDQNKPIDGANDGGSGVGILLEVARAIKFAQKKPEVGLDILFFDVEDYGQPEDSKFPEQQDSWCLGSQYWSKNKHTPGYTAFYGILLDMAGAKDAKFAMEGTSMYYAGEVVKKVWGVAASIGYSNYFVQQLSDQIIDDHLYVNSVAKIPMIDIIEYSKSKSYYFTPAWHTHADKLDLIDKNTLKAVGQTLLQVVYNE